MRQTREVLKTSRVTRYVAREFGPSLSIVRQQSANAPSFVMRSPRDVIFNLNLGQGAPRSLPMSFAFVNSGTEHVLELLHQISRCILTAWVWKEESCLRNRKVIPSQVDFEGAFGFSFRSTPSIQREQGSPEDSDDQVSC